MTVTTYLKITKKEKTVGLFILVVVVFFYFSFYFFILFYSPRKVYVLFVRLQRDVLCVQPKDATQSEKLIRI